MAKPGQLKKQEFDELVVPKLFDDRWHHLKKCLHPEAQDTLIAIRFSEWLLRYQLIVVLEATLGTKELVTVKFDVSEDLRAFWD